MRPWGTPPTNGAAAAVVATSFQSRDHVGTRRSTTAVKESAADSRQTPRRGVDFMIGSFHRAMHADGTLAYAKLDRKDDLRG